MRPQQPCARHGAGADRDPPVRKAPTPSSQQGKSKRIDPWTKNATAMRSAMSREGPTGFSFCQEGYQQETGCGTENW